MNVLLTSSISFAQYILINLDLFLCGRCHWEVLLWLLYSFQVVSSRSREWSSLHSLLWFSPRRCKLLKLVQIDANQSPPHNHCVGCRLTACHRFDQIRPVPLSGSRHRQWRFPGLVGQWSQRPKDPGNPGEEAFVPVGLLQTADLPCLVNGILTECPSLWPCRKIFNDLSSEEVSRTEGKDSSPASTGVTVPATQIYQTSSGQYCMNLLSVLVIDKSLLLEHLYREHV